MKKILYLMISVCITGCLCSCNDDNDNKPEALSGTWEYEKPHFEFEYAADTISIEMYQNRKLSIAVSDFKNLFLQMAGEKMAAYFEGISFSSDQQLTINARLQSGSPLQLHAAYEQKDDILQVTLDREEMEQLVGEKAAMIPAISFKYIQKKNKLILYFDQAYIRTVYSMMQPQIVVMVIQMMGIDPSRMPEGMENLVKDQINGILDRIILLEVGFQLIPAELDV